MPGFGPHQASRRRRNSGGTPAPTPTLAALSLAVPTIAENTVAGSVIGPIAGRTTGSTLSLFDDAGGRFALSGANLLAGLTATNFEAATSHAITIRETLAGATNNPRDTVLSVAVTNLFEAASLSALTLSSTAYTIGTPSSGTITGATAGSTIAASGVPAGLTVNGAARTWAWSGSGSAASTTIVLTETLADSANSPRASNVGVTVAAGIGGIEIGAAGSGIYSGYTLSWGDEFTALDLIGPNDPTGYLTNRGTISMPGARSGAGSAHYYTDPQHTGFNDYGRGTPPITDTLSIQGGTRLKLLTRKATAGEQLGFAASSYGAGKPVIAASAINTARNLLFYVGTSSGNMIVEAKIRHTAKAGNPAGWHPTFWTFSGAPTVEDVQDEWDITEGNSQGSYLSHNRWVGGVAANVTIDGPLDLFDGNDHTYTLVMSRADAKVYIDGVLTYTKVTDSNSKNLPAYLILTNVVYLASFGGESFSEAAWTADANGAATEVDWLRVWRKTGLPHYVPLTSVSSPSIAYAGTDTIVLPSKAALWGDAGVTEYVQCIAGEVNDPTDNVKFLQFPPGVSYDSGTRTITINWTASSTPPGRLLFTVQAYQAAGSTCVPLTFEANRGPKVTLASQSWTQNVAISSVDAYVAASVGNLLPKTVAVTSLPTGLLFNSGTGLITGTPTSGSSGNLTIQVTNCVGQSVSTNVAFTVAAGDVTAPTLSLPTDAANGSTGGTLTVTTNEANGTLYWFVSTSASPPTAANLKTGTGAVSSGNQAVSATGVQNSAATGLTASTAYFAHFLHRDTAGNDSAIVSGDGFTTAAGSWVTSGALVDLDYQNDRAFINGTTYASIAAARAGLLVQTGGIDRVAVSGFITSAYTLAGKGTTHSVSVLGQPVRYLATLDDGADGAPADELIFIGQGDVSATSKLLATVFDNSVDQTNNLLTANVGNSAAARIGLSIAVNDLAASLNGGTVITDTVATLPTVTQLVVGNREDGTRPWLGAIGRIVLLNTAISDAALPGLLA